MTPGTGRIEIIDMGGFTIDELPDDGSDTLGWRGGFPRSCLAVDDAASRQWRADFIRTVIECDLPALGVQIAGVALSRFWAMLAHLHGQPWNAADPARSLGVNESTVRRYLDGLTQLFMVRQLQPWLESLAKRQVRSPKVYIRDTGLLHALLGVPSVAALRVHARSGASWEGFVIEQILRIARPDAAY